MAASPPRSAALDLLRHGGERAVRLLDHDPDLGATLAPERLEEARLTALANAIFLPRGHIDPAALQRAEGSPYGLLVLDGLIARTVRLRETTAMQLLGRSDLLAPGSEQDAVTLVPAQLDAHVLEPASVALLDDRFLFAIRRWPEIVAALFERLTAQAARLATHCAISQLPRVEDRIHALLWFLAERWGRMTPQGVILPLRLTHDMLGRLIGAKRPTVSLAVKELEARDAVHRRADGAWLLHEDESTPDRKRPDSPPFAARFVPEPGHPAPSPFEPVGAELPLVEVVETAMTGEALRSRIDRMRSVHSRTSEDVRGMIARSALTRERSRALRERLRAEAADAAGGSGDPGDG